MMVTIVEWPKSEAPSMEVWAKVLERFADLEARLAASEARAVAAEREREEQVDAAATYVLDTLAQALGNPAYSPCDGSETWEGDVGGTIYEILRAARVLDPETDELAVARAEKAEAALAETRKALAPDLTSDQKHIGVVISRDAKGNETRVSAKRWDRSYDGLASDWITIGHYLGDGCWRETDISLADAEIFAAIIIHKVRLQVGAALLTTAPGDGA